MYCYVQLVGGSLSQVDIIYPTPPSMESHQNEQSPHQKSDGIEMMEENFKVNYQFAFLNVEISLLYTSN